MATYVPPKINTAYVFYISLVSQANTKVFQANPTLAAGDFNVATEDGAPGGLGTTPTVDADFTKRVKVTLAAGEMNGGNVTLICSDAAGAEWCDLTINIQTSARQVDDLAFPVTSGRGLDVTATGAAGIDWANVENPTTALALTGTTIATTQKVDVETIKTNPVVNGGTVTFTTNSTVASTTNITGGVITTVTNLTNAPTNGDLTATMKSSVTTAVPTAAQIATGVWQDATAGDFTAASSIGKSVMNGVALGTGLTVNDLTTKTGFSLTQAFPTNFADMAITVTTGRVTGGTNADKTGYSISGTKTTLDALNDIAATAIVSSGAITTNAGKVSGVILADTVTTYTGNTPQTGDAFARIGAAGASLTALGDARIANLDAAVSSRMATYTQPAGFLAATFPTDPADQSLIISATNTILADTNAILLDTGTDGVVVAATSKSGYALSS